MNSGEDFRKFSGLDFGAQTRGTNAGIRADFISDVVPRTREIFLIEECDFNRTAWHALKCRDHKLQSEFGRGEIGTEFCELHVRFGIREMIHVPKAARIIIDQKFGSKRGDAFEDEMRVFIGGTCVSDKPCAGHAEMREQMRPVRQNEVEHFAFAGGTSEGEAV